MTKKNILTVSHHPTQLHLCAVKKKKIGIKNNKEGKIFSLYY